MNIVKLFKGGIIAFVLLTGCDKNESAADCRDENSKFLNTEYYFTDARIDVINDRIIVCHPDVQCFNINLENIEYSVFDEEKNTYKVEYEFNHNKDILLIKGNKLFKKVNLVISYNGIVLREWMQ
jgi:hypothetical protein